MKKGFSIVELVVSISLISIIVTMLFQIIISAKNLYTLDNTKTELLINQANLSYLINFHFINNEVINVTPCGDKCVTFLYRDNNTENLKIDNNVIILGNKRFIYPKGTEFDRFNYNINLVDSTSYIYNATLNIDIGIKNRLFSNSNFDIKIVYPYNTSIAQLMY